MRTYLKWSLPSLTLLILLFLFWNFTQKLNYKQQITERTHMLPDVIIYSLDSSAIYTKTFTGQPVVLIYFDPDCDHCQREADEVRKKAALLDQAHVLLLSSAPLSTLKSFAQNHQLHKLRNIQVAQIDRDTAYERLGFTTIPDVRIYRADGTLAKHFRGETSIEAIARHF